MFRSEKNFEWLSGKYGQSVRPWEYHITLDNKDWQQTLLNGQNKIQYTYALKNDFAIQANKQEEWEREPNRILEI